MLPILSITGSDSSGVSGVQADVRTITSLGGTVATAITCLTVQTSLGIKEFFDVPSGIVKRQIDAVMGDTRPEVVKIGLIRSRSVLRVIVDALRSYCPRHVIYDPVFLSARGEVLVPAALREQIETELLPLCTYVVSSQTGSLPRVHGLRGAMASAVCVYLSMGESVERAVARAGDFISTLIVRSRGDSSRSAQVYNEFIGRVSRHIQSYHTVDFYADRLNISTRYLTKVCQRVSGKTPKNIIDYMLMKHILTQLQTTADTVQQIAHGCGFRTQAHLTAFFKKKQGMTPTQYRKQWRPL